MSKAIMIEVDDEASVYRLVGPGDEEGAITDYGVPATLRIGKEMYVAYIGNDGLADADLGPDAFLATAVETDVEDVAFDLTDEPGETTTVETETEEADEGDEDDSADGADTEDAEDGKE